MARGDGRENDLTNPMSFSSWQAFFHMGGYGLYVWAAYGLTLVILSALLIAPVRRHRRLRQDLQRRARLRQRDNRRDDRRQT